MGKHYDDPVEFFLDMEWESRTGGEPYAPGPPSQALRDAWDEWREDVANTILGWGDAEGLGDEVARIIQEEDMFEADVYFTLGGHGVGIWDGRWDKYLKRADVKRLQTHLEQQLGNIFRKTEEAFMEEGDRQAPKEMKLFDDLDGLNRRRPRRQTRTALVPGAAASALPLWARTSRRR